MTNSKQLKVLVLLGWMLVALGPDDVRAHHNAAHNQNPNPPSPLRC